MGSLTLFSWSGRCFTTYFRCNFRSNSRVKISHTIVCAIRTTFTFYLHCFTAAVFKFSKNQLISNSVITVFRCLQCLLSKTVISHFSFEYPSFHNKKHILVLVLSIVNWHVFSVISLLLFWWKEELKCYASRGGEQFSCSFCIVWQRNSSH
jgi:hypothetical protein